MIQVSYLRTATTGAAPVSLANMKVHLGVTHTHHDDMIEAIMNAAVARFEKETNGVLRTSAWQMFFINTLGYTAPVKIFKCPVTAISKVEQEVDGEWTDITTDCTLNTNFSPATVELDNAVTSTLSLRITFTAGATVAKPISALAIQAIKMATKHWYNNRSEVEPIRSFAEVPNTFNTIVQLERVFEF